MISVQDDCQGNGPLVRLLLRSTRDCIKILYYMCNMYVPPKKDFKIAGELFDRNDSFKNQRIGRTVQFEAQECSERGKARDRVVRQCGEQCGTERGLVVEEANLTELFEIIDG